ncbi:MAG: hypothetical protein WCO78_01065 [Candidatus Roizmanbacteria bacterium]
MLRKIIFVVVVAGTCFGISRIYIHTQSEALTLRSKYADQIIDVYRLQGRKVDPGFEPIEKSGSTNLDKGKRNPSFRGVGAVAGVSDVMTGLNPVGAITDRKTPVQGSVIEIATRSLYQRDQGYYCNSTYLSQYVLWIKDIPMIATYAPCVTRIMEFYSTTKLKPEDIRIEYTNDTSINQESNDLLVQSVVLDGKSIVKSSTNASWTLNQCTAFIAIPSSTDDLIMHCNGYITFTEQKTKLASPEAALR